MDNEFDSIYTKLRDEPINNFRINNEISNKKPSRIKRDEQNDNFMKKLASKRREFYKPIEMPSDRKIKVPKITDPAKINYVSNPRDHFN